MSWLQARLPETWLDYSLRCGANRARSGAGKHEQPQSPCWRVDIFALADAARGNSGEAAQVPCKMALVGETCFQRHLANGEASFSQQALGALHAPANYILVDG